MSHKLNFRMILRAKACNIFQNTRFLLASTINQSAIVSKDPIGGAVVETKRETWNLIYKNDKASNEMTKRYWNVRYGTRKLIGFIGTLYCLEIFLFLGTGWGQFQPDIRDFHACLLGLGFSLLQVAILYITRRNPL